MSLQIVKNRINNNKDNFKMNYSNDYASSQFLRQTTSFFNAKQTIDTKQVIQQCMKQNIQLVNLPDRRLQNSVAVISLKAKLKNNHNQGVTIFITKYNDEEITMVCFSNNKQIDQVKLNANKIEEVTKNIKSWVNKSSVNNSYQKNNRQQQDKRNQSERIIGELHKKCIQISSKQKNQLFAIQQLKLTGQYNSLLYHQAQLNTKIISLTQNLISCEQKIQDQNQRLLDKMVQLQILKSDILTMEYQFDEVSKGLRNAKDLIQDFIKQRGSTMDQMNIYNMDDLKKYIQQAQQLKKLQNYKRFLF